MSDRGADELVTFLRRETGDHLHIVLKYGPDAWKTLFLSDIAGELIERAGSDVADLLESFRGEGRRNRRLRSGFDLGENYCSLHLFDELVLIHFSATGDRGVIFGYDPASAPHLTGFVSLVLPHVRAAGIDGLDPTPAWESR